MLGLRLMRAVATPNADEAPLMGAAGSPWRMPPCKQLVVIPLGGEQKRGYGQWMRRHHGGDGAVQQILSELCGLQVYTQGASMTSGVQYYIDTSMEGVADMFKKGCGWCKTDAGAYRTDCSVYNQPNNDLGQVFPVVLIHDAAYTTGYNMEAVQRIHFTDWCDPTIAAQAMGRAQRIGASKRLPIDRRQAVVFTYSICGNADRGSQAGQSEAGSAVMRELDRDLAMLGEAVVTAHTVLRRLAADEYARLDAIRPLLMLARESAEGDPGRNVSESDYRLLVMVEHERMVNLPLSVTLATRLRNAGQTLGSSVPPEACALLFAGATSTNARFDAAMNGWKHVRGHIDTVRSPVRDLAAALVRELDNIATRISTVARGYADIASAMQVAASWRGRTRPRALATIDEMLAAAHAAAYEPVLRLYEGMMRASVSCALYAALHAEYGQLPGLPQTCGIPQRIRCLNGKEARGLACGGGKAKSVALDKETLSGPIEALGVAVNELYARGAATFDAAYAEEQENTAANDVTAKARDRLRAELRLLDPLTIRARATQAGVTVEPDHDVEDITELIVRASVGGANATDAERRELRDGNARSSIRQEERAARRVAAALGHVFDRFAAAGCGVKTPAGAALCAMWPRVCSGRYEPCTTVTQGRLLTSPKRPHGVVFLWARRWDLHRPEPSRTRRGPHCLSPAVRRPHSRAPRCRSHRRWCLRSCFGRGPLPAQREFRPPRRCRRPCHTDTGRCRRSSDRSGRT